MDSPNSTNALSERCDGISSLSPRRQRSTQPSSFSSKPRRGTLQRLGQRRGTFELVSEIAFLASSVHVGDDPALGFQNKCGSRRCGESQRRRSGLDRERRAYRHGTSFLYVSQSFLYLCTSQWRNCQHPLSLRRVRLVGWKQGRCGLSFRPLTCARMPRRRESDGVRGEQQSRLGRSTAAAS